MKQISERVRLLNDKPANNDGKYILYWMQRFKRATNNHALNFAMERPIYRQNALYNDRRHRQEIWFEKIYRMDEIFGKNFHITGN